MLNQPEKNPNSVPENLKKEIEKVRNQITTGEVEVTRLKGLVKAETYTVGELMKSKKALEEDMKRLIKAELDKQNAIKELLKELAELKERKTAERSEMDALTLTNDDIKKSISKLQDEEAELELSIKDSRKSLEETSEQLIGKRNKLSTLIEKLKEILKISLVIVVIAGAAFLLYSLTDTGRSIIANIIN